MDHKRNNFLDGFVLGAVIGGAAVFLLGTKKGREVLNIVKEEGMSRFGKFEDILHEYQDSAADDDDMEEYLEDEVKSSGSKEEKKAPRRRLFKGVTKRK